MKIQSLIAVICTLLVLQSRASDNLPHPILSISGSGSGASTVTNIAESAYTNNFIPHTPPRADAYFAPAVVSGDTGWSWSSSAPNQLKSTPSGTIFPNTNTAQYPVRTQAVTVFLTTATNNDIQTVNALYYNRAGSTTAKSMVFNVIDLHKRDQLRSDFNKLAPAYLLSGSSPTSRNDNYARRIAVSLLDWARWYPTYYLSPINSAGYINVTTNYSASTGGFGPQRASDHNGLAHEWEDDELKAFDAIYSSVALTNLTAEMGFDVRQYICDNLFFNEGDFLVNHIPVDIAIQSNLSGPYAVLPEVARVLDRPDYIVWLDSYLDATVRKKIRRDGTLEEGEGYSIGYLNSNQDAAQNTSDYFLTRAATNSLLFAISNRAKIYNTSLKYGQAQWATVALPNGQLPSFGDTPFDTYFTARNKGNSAVLPAYGALSLGAGSSSGTSVQLNQSFPGNNNHMRADMAAFSLWAFGNEYLGNIRYYNGAIGRDFGEQMLEKNDVTIDRANLSPYPDADTYGNGNLDIYEPGNSGIAMTEIDGYRGYSSKASRFQRLMILNTVDVTNKPYVVDIFRVTGGATHDYTFHGSVRWTQTGQCSFPLVTNNNQYPMLEGSETWDLSSDTPYYGFWRGVSSNTAPGTFYLTYTDTNRSSARDTRLWMTADPNVYNVYLGWTPVPARDDTVPTNFFNNLGLTRPSAIIRHRVTSGSLQDLFVSVIEPFKSGVSNIVSVERLAMSNSLESVGLKITFKDGRVDTYIVNLRNTKAAGAGGGAAVVGTLDGQYSLAGRVGLHVDQPDGASSRVLTVNATDFKYPGRELATPSNIYYSGWIAGETRKINGDTYDAFTTTTPLPTGTTLRNEYLLFTHGTLSGTSTTNISEMFKIDQVVLTNGLYHVCFANDHMLEITNGISSHEQVAPLRTFTTSNAFEIVLSAFAGQISPIAAQTIASGDSSAPINFTFGNLGNTSGSSLQVIANSSNQALVPDANLAVSNSGTNGTITVSTVPGQTGSAVVTVSTTDGTWTNSQTFNVTVPDFTLSSSAPQAINAGSNAGYTIDVSAIAGFNGTVSLSANGLPTGATVTFSPASVNGAGSSALTVNTSASTPAGTYTITITGTSGNLTRTTTVTLDVMDFSVSTPSSPQTVVVGDSATYTASAAALDGFGGTIAWSISGLPAGATANFSPATVDGSGDSILTVTTSGSTPSGSYTLTITGTSGSVVHSTTVTLIVSDFSVSATPSSQSVTVGNGTAYTVNIGAVNGFNGAVNLSLSGLPAGATAVFNPASVTGSGAATLTITTTASTPPSTNTLIVTGTSGGLVHSASVSLAVTAPPDYSLAVSPPSQTVVAGNSTTYTATITQANGFAGTVAFTVTGLPSGVTANFNPASVTGSGSATLTITTATSTPVGTNTLTITGASGSLVHSVSVSLVVTPSPNFSLVATPASRTITAGSNTTYTATASALNGFSSAITFSVSGLPSGATASFSPTSITGAGSSTLTVNTTASTPPGTNILAITGTSGSLVHSTNVTFIVNGVVAALPAGWTNADLGAVGLAGSAGYNAGTFTTKGSGADIWTTGDQFNYTYQSANGDATIIARLVSENGTQSFAKAGVMIRETLATNAIEVSVLLTPTNGVAMEVRSTNGVATVNPTGWIKGPVPPQWVKLARIGSMFTGYYSTNGSAWTQLTATNVTMGFGATAGLAVTAHANTALNTAIFDNVSVNGNSLQGIYWLQNIASGLVLNNQGFLTNGPAITQWTFKTNANLQWTFIATSNGYYQINSLKSGLDAAVQNASTANGAGIVQWSFGSLGNDQWKPVQNSDFTYTFFNLHSGLVIEDPGSSTSTSTQMDQWSANGGTNQKWKLIPQ